jgi:diadenosine tetraphosphate (Ap4A) HIT family hydrolase
VGEAWGWWGIRDSLQETFDPQGSTIGVDDGIAAGQTGPHAHIHVIPRRDGDVSELCAPLPGLQDGTCF